MLDIKKLRKLDVAFQRILMMGMGRSSFRQMQNAMFQAVDGSQDAVTALLEGLLNPQKRDEKTPETPLQEFIERYSFSVSVAKEVAERAEFVRSMTSDLISPDMPLLGNHISRFDGEELRFISDPESSLQIIRHLLKRLSDLQQAGKSGDIFKELKGELQDLKQQVNELIDASAS